MSAFELEQTFRDKNGGAHRYETRQLFPQTAAISGTRPGVSGATTGQTTFQWNDDVLWWVPALSFFNFRGHFLDGAGNALARPPTNGISYVDNWCSVLFQQIQIFCNSQTVELLQNPPQADTALLYSTVDRTWLKSFGSASGVGEALQTRLLNSGQFGTAAVSATNYNEVVATWRPSLSLFDSSTAIPPGAQWRVDFSWANSGEQNMIESLFGAKIAGTDFTFVVDELTFYKATLAPAPETPLPTHGIIELNPIQVNTYPLTGGNTLQVNVPLPATCERMLIGMQDNNAAGSLAAGQNGVKSITAFSPSASLGATDNNSFIQNLYVSFPELGYQAPNPTYALTALNAAGAKSDWNRAYQDFISVCKGASGGYEGSVPFGTADIGIGANINAPLLTGGGPVVTAGDPNNDQTAFVWTAGTGASTFTATSANQTAKNGWLGKQTLFAIPVVRPADKIVTNANLAVTMSASVTSVNFFVIMQYSMAIACERGQDGRWHFEIVRGA